ncbi:cystatin-like [Scyliorhinus torazame]|uniref:cystatin-like n=1 Tax=Scyliorhinus torazame TaxID=75743 RepID=UPI003B59D48F
MCTCRVLAVVLAAVCAQTCESPKPSMMGGVERVSVDHPEVLKAAQFAVAEYNKASNDMFASKIVRIVSAQQQAVAGMKYIFEVELGRTQCKQSEVHDLETCDFAATPQKTFCNFVVLSVPWRGQMSLTKTTCRPSNN